MTGCVTLGAGAMAAGSAALTGCSRRPGASSSARHGRAQGTELGANDDEAFWEEVREQFALSPDHIHLSSLFISSNPKPVRDAIQRYREELDQNPTLTLLNGNRQRLRAVHNAAADYLGADWDHIALTGNTTTGLGVVYNGLEVRQDQELLTTEDDYYSTVGSMRFRAQRLGTSLRRVSLYDRPEEVTQDDLVERILGGIDSNTRVLGLTWVHSSTGIKLPISRIAQNLREDINRDRGPEDRVILCVDGVHGFGVEDVTMEDLGCDFFIAGTHKWLYGPRGTGFFYGRPGAQEFLTPTIPTFTSWAQWGGRQSPGGFHTFENRWALAEAFRWHQGLGKANVETRIHRLNTMAKEGLAGMNHVRLITPLDEDLSAGIVCFQVDGMTSRQVARALRERNIVATPSPYQPSYARITPGIVNSPEDINIALNAIDDL